MKRSLITTSLLDQKTGHLGPSRTVFIQPQNYKTDGTFPSRSERDYFSRKAFSSQLLDLMRLPTWTSSRCGDACARQPACSNTARHGTAQHEHGGQPQPHCRSRAIRPQKHCPALPSTSRRVFLFASCVSFQPSAHLQGAAARKDQSELHRRPRGTRRVRFADGLTEISPGRQSPERLGLLVLPCHVGGESLLPTFFHP